MATVFEFYRFTRFKLVYLPSVSGFTWLAIGYNGGVPNTAPTSGAQVGELGCSVVVGQSQTVRTTLNVPRRVLQNTELKWYATTGAVVPQGIFYLGTPGSFTGGIQLWVEYEIEFCSPVATGFTRPVPETRKMMASPPEETKEPQDDSSQVTEWDDVDSVSAALSRGLSLLPSLAKAARKPK